MVKHPTYRLSRSLKGLWPSRDNPWHSQPDNGLGGSDRVNNRSTVGVDYETDFDNLRH